VYIKEQDAFSSSVVAVPTAVPAFVGYTERAVRGKQKLYQQPTRVTSLAEYIEMFGTGPKTTFEIKPEGDLYTLEANHTTRFNVYNAVRMFYQNGGGNCYIVSSGAYDYSKGVDPEDLNSPGKGLDTLLKEQEPTILLIPDALLLEEDDCYSLYQAMVTHCGAKMRSRMAILDVYNGDKEWVDGKNVIQAFREKIGSNNLAFACVYYPWLNTTVTTPSEVDYRNISNRDVLVDLLKQEAQKNIFGDEIPALAGAKNVLLEEANSLIASINDKNLAEVMGKLKEINVGFKAPKGDDAKKAQEDLAKQAAKLLEQKASANTEPDPRVEKLQAIWGEIDKLSTDNDAKKVGQTILAISPLYKDILKSLREKLNLQSPSGAIAGMWSLVDSQEGVHKAPANVSLNGVTGPVLNITASDQEDLNLPLNGKAVNAIRSFVGKGTLVWGARTLDGNSQDWRYINVRRTMIMIEQSIKNSVEAYVFEPNVSRTWIKVKTSIENFLTDCWKSGALAGASPSQAYDVNVGLGNTMTPVDILEGMMRISVKVAITRPAEFIEITFEQKMQES
jgi:hypothetical protein